MDVSLSELWELVMDRETGGDGIVTECSSMKGVFVQAAQMNCLLLCSAGTNPQRLDLTCS